MRLPPLTVTLAGLVMLTGCGAPPRDQGFSDVAHEVHSRTGLTVQWQHAGVDDAAVAEKIHGLLAENITPESAVQIALLNNPRLHATYQSLGVSQADLVQAGLLRNPTLVAGVKFFGEGPKVELSLVENFLQIFTLPARQRFAEAQLAQAKAMVAGAIIDLIADVRQESYRVLAAQQTLELRRTVLQAMEASADLAKRIHDAGNSTDLKFASEIAATEQSRLDVSAAEETVLIARERLTTLLGLWGPEAVHWTMTGRLPDLPAEDGTGDGTGLERQAVRASFDLAAQREGMRAIGERFGIERLDAWFGEVQLGAVGERESNGDWGFGPEAGISIPIFDQGQGRQAAATAALDMAARTYVATAVGLRSQVRVARAQVRSAHARAHFIFQVLVPLRSRVVRESQLHYNGMLMGPFQLLDAKRQEVETAEQYIDALERYWLERSVLDQTLTGRMTMSGRDATSAPRMMGADQEKRHE